MTRLRSGALKRVTAWVLAAVATGVPASVSAQSTCSTHSARPDAAERWTEPLVKSISLDLRDVTLREALRRLTSAAGIRISYSAELLPLERSICVSYDAVALGDALAGLLENAAVEPVAAGADHVVLAPRRSRSAQSATASAAVLPLAPLAVDVDAVAVRQKSPAFTVDVIDGQRLSGQSTGSLAQALNGTVPGMWLWSRAGTGLSAQYGSIRGASSFGASQSKIYIDGIEVANPMLLARLYPESIERIEVIRGPEGAALYGANGINGVTNIITRHEAFGAGTPRARIRSGAGLASTDFAGGPALAQEHVLNLRAGAAERSASVNLAVGSTGELIPGGGTRHLSASGSGRWIRSKSLLTGTLRLFAERAGSTTSPLLDSITRRLPGTATSSPTAPSATQEVIQYTAGIRALFTPNPRWTHSVVLGIDGYTLDGVDADRSPFLLPADSALRAAGSAGVRGTLRLSAAARFNLGQHAGGGFTMTAEHSSLSQRGDGEALDWIELSRSNTGIGAQLDAAFLDRMFLTGGLRLERQTDAFLGGRAAALPMLGGAVVGEIGPADVKLRAAYGKGIRWPDIAVRNARWDPRRPADAVELGAEEQGGIEAGLDITLGRAFALRVTRFDQTASGLIQRIAVTDSQRTWRHDRQPGFELQNVGEIANGGWEMQATAQRGRLALAATLALIDSRVRAVAADYTGDLRPGDRMLAVPARTMGLTASWSGGTWSTSVTAARAADWINYDRVALTRALLSSDTPEPNLIGDLLRAYWREYDGITHLRATLAREIRRGVTLSIAGENLLNRQLGEPDNATVIAGRTISIGVRAEL